jgi:hypothetical protein
MGNLKSNKTKEEWDDLVNKTESHSDQVIDKMNNDKDAKVTRLEIINHTTGYYGEFKDKPKGRIFSMYKELNDFNNIELCYQDGGRTLKIFLT